MSNKSHNVYWLTIEPTAQHIQIANQLKELNYTVSFFKTLSNLMERLRSERVGIIILGDEGPEAVVHKAITKLHKMPEIQGARLILSCSRYTDTLLRSAACHNFRDILPIDLDLTTWCQRFLFSIGMSQELNSQDSPKLMTSESLELKVPARINWLSENTIRLESRIFPPAETPLTLTGPIAQALGQKHLKMTVLHAEQENLLYRFSNALICHWSPPQDSELLHETLDQIERIKVSRYLKTFLVIQSPALRSSIIRHLENGPYEIRTALQKKSLQDEPKYFGPHIIIIEARLTCGSHEARFHSMLENLSNPVLILVIGAENGNMPFHDLSTKHFIYGIKSVPMNFSEAVLKLSEQNLTQQPIAYQHLRHLPSNHEYSLAEISITASLTQLHPGSTALNVPYPIGNYGLIYLESPLLKKITGRYPYSKITEASIKNPATSQNSYKLEAHFCDLNHDQRELVDKACQALHKRRHKTEASETSILQALPSAKNSDSQQKPQRTPLAALISHSFIFLIAALLGSLTTYVILKKQNTIKVQPRTSQQDKS